jgi:hypothetical protein
MEDKARNNRLTDVTMLLDGGTTANLIRYGGGGNMEITNKGEPTAALLFGQGQPLERKPVIPSLYKLAELTLRTIQTLELFWFLEKAER